MLLRSSLLPCGTLCDAIVSGGMPGMLCDVSSVIPRRLASARAASTVMPTKFGTTIGCGPFETISVMRLPSATSRRAWAADR